LAFSVVSSITKVSVKKKFFKGVKMSKSYSYDLVEWDKPFQMAERAVLKPTGRSVLVKVIASGLCHSDLHIKKGFMDLGERGKLTFEQRGAKLPITLGHEIAGEVVDVGEGVADVVIGQKVLVFPWIGCGNCRACDEDRESDCTSMSIIGIHQNGGFASHVLVPDEKFVLDITGLDPVKIAPYACSGVTVFNALTKVGALREDEWLAVIGVGGLGLNAISIAVGMGYKNIIAIDVSENKLELAIEMGANRVLDSTKLNSTEELINITNGLLYGVLDTFGSEETGSLAVNSLTKAGRYVVVGQHGGDFKMPQVWLPQKAMTVRGSHVGNSPQLRQIIEMYRAGKLKDIPIEIRPLSEINSAVEELKAGHVSGRIVFCP
jgi:D-arabinose 1-dehydrogenase-like Zn-dependent alcohol dehydrogenase